MNIKHYLERINYQGTLFPTFDELKNLQKQHLLNIPFENWFIHDNKPIKLDTASLFQKIVVQQRGGFCYELNGLFFALLQTLAFNARLVSARVYSASTDNYGKEFDHMAIVVTLDEQDYLVDVGFGEFAFYPLKIESNKVQHDPRGDFLLKKDAEDFIVYKKTVNNFQPEYRFNLLARQLDDFLAMCHYHQSSSQSHFSQKRLLSLATENGRITLSGEMLSIREGDKITEKVLSGAVNSIIERYFSPFPTTANN